jgi:hypothetical protein
MTDLERLKDACAKAEPLRVGIAVGMTLYCASLEGARAEGEAALAVLGPSGRMFAPEAFRNLDVIAEVAKAMREKRAQIEAQIGLTDEERVGVEVLAKAWTEQARTATREMIENGGAHA